MGRKDVKYISRVCPVCNKIGQPVPWETVKALVRGPAPVNKQYLLCLTPSCKVAWYSESGEFLLQAQAKVPIAFKEGAKPKYVCYCSKVTEQDVLNAVLSRKAVTLSEVIQTTGAMAQGNCRDKNPSGASCHQEIKAVFQRAVEMLEQNIV